MADHEVHRERVNPDEEKTMALVIMPVVCLQPIGLFGGRSSAPKSLAIRACYTLPTEVSLNNGGGRGSYR